MFGFTAQRPMPSGMPTDSGPWGGLPTAGAPWGGSAQVWQPAQQAPWRLSPWSTQGMPAAAPVAPVAPAAAPASPYLPQGVSSDIPGFDPMMPGGGFAPQPPAPAVSAGAPQMYYNKGAMRATTDPGLPGVNIPVTPEFLMENPFLPGWTDQTHPLLQPGAMQAPEWQPYIQMMGGPEATLGIVRESPLELQNRYNPPPPMPGMPGLSAY